MYWYQDSDGSVSIVQMDSELQRAQLELLSAHCAVHQLRLRYSPDDLARFGRRDVLRKSAETASALNQFYAAVEKKIPHTAPPAEAVCEPTSSQIAQAVEWITTYLQQERELYLPAASPLDNRQRARLWPHFSAELLDRIRILELRGARVVPPAFFAQARALGFEPPEVTHMDSLTFIDVVVFNQGLTERSLLHALVHAVQIEVLGLERYAELWVRSFVKTRAHFTVPLEVHAFSLASRFLHPASERFSVEDQVRIWLADGRY